MKATMIRWCACAPALLLACRLAVAVDGPDRPVAVKKSPPAVAGSSKASSFAPRGHSTHPVYGAPISAPILHHRKPPRKTPPS